MSEIRPLELVPSEVTETSLIPEWASRTLRADEMAPILRRAQEESAAPPLTLRENLYETTIMMDRTAINAQNRTLRPEEFPAVPRTSGDEIASSPASGSPLINLRVEQTPAEFSHLYASLERQIAGVGDVTLVSGETLGAERPYVLGVTSAVLGEGKRLSLCIWR